MFAQKKCKFSAKRFVIIYRRVILALYVFITIFSFYFDIEITLRLFVLVLKKVDIFISYLGPIFGFVDSPLVKVWPSIFKPIFC